MTAPKSATRKAPAKINLFLHIGDRRADGYHNLQSLVVFADVCDTITIHPAEKTGLSIAGPYSKSLQSDPGNLVIKAAEKLENWAKSNRIKVQQVSIHLEKQLPIAAGIGGGSSDAAATLLLLAEAWSLPISIEELSELALTLGADVPVCLRATPAVMCGIGERIERAPQLPEFALLLVNSGDAVSTAQAFQALTVRSGAAPVIIPDKFNTVREFVAFLDRSTNDLSAPAKGIAPSIMDVERALVATQGCLLARVSGSGATCFGIYPTIEAAERARAEISEKNQHWWIRSANLFDVRCN